MGWVKFLLGTGAIALVGWIVLAYLQPELRKAIMYYGAGLC